MWEKTGEKGREWSRQFSWQKCSGKEKCFGVIPYISLLTKASLWYQELQGSDTNNELSRTNLIFTASQFSVSQEEVDGTCTPTSLSPSPSSGHVFLLFGAVCLWMAKLTSRSNLKPIERKVPVYLWWNVICYPCWVYLTSLLSRDKH